ncbi:hypothetical protein BURPS1655_I0801 [Burkholderia pseudomallei 1655]|nr:hypothetical protein BURPS1655_I0801 [Burkholderia pseudomallei 1655]
MCAPRDARPGRPPRRTGHAPPCRTHTVLHRTRSVLRCLAAHRRRAARNRCDRPPSRVASRFTTVGTALA